MNPEYLGLTASIIILISGMMQSEKRLRVIDAFGSVLMAVYGAIIHAPSVVLLNGCLTIAHLYRLWRIREEENNAKRDASKQPKGFGGE